MKLPRRKFLKLAAGTAALPALPRAVWAQAYPNRVIRLVVGFVPAGAVDIFARLIGQWLSERLGQQVVIENRAGAAGNIGTEAVANAAPDGYTLLLLNVSNAINQTLYEKLNFNLVRDIAPVAGIAGVPNLMEVNPGVPAKTVPEFIAYAKANPGKINIGSGGTGTSPHMSSELFKMMAKIDMVHVPYRGAAASLTDLLGGQVQVMFDNMPSSIEYVRAGKLRPLAVTTTQRSPALPDVPAIAEFLPGYEVNAWFGVGAPKATPPEIVNRLNREINAGLADPKLKAKIADLGGTPLVLSPAEFTKLVADEVEKWAKVVKFAGVKPE